MMVLLFIKMEVLNISLEYIPFRKNYKILIVKIYKGDINIK